MKQYTVYFSEPVCHKYIGDKFNRELKTISKQKTTIILPCHSERSEKSFLYIKEINPSLRSV